MAKINKDTLGYLGYEYQIKLIAQLITDKRFANSILDIVDPNYFEDRVLRLIVAQIKEARETYGVILDVVTLEIRILETVNEDIQRKYFLQQLRKIGEDNLNDTLYVQDTAMRFCKQQELIKSVKQITKIIDKGDIEDYEECEKILRQALDHGDNKDNTLDIFDGIEKIFEKDFRSPIRTGIEGLDVVMNGGLAKGELAVVLAPFGVGKTTMMTKIANTATFDGKKVVQIFFEDSERVIQSKHVACWSGIELNEIPNNKDYLMNMVAELKKTNGGALKLKKFSSDGTTIPMIRQYIRKLIAQGFTPDLILLDYIDCVEPSKRFDDINVGEGNVMRQFETMLSEMDIAGWTAVQGNRSSIKAEVVEGDQMGGSIKKAQIAHFVVSIAKTLEQKENDTATMAIIKSRFGKSGMLFEDIRFDNARIQIDMGDSTGSKSRSEFKQDKGVKEQAYVKDLLDAKKKTELLSSISVPKLEE